MPLAYDPFWDTWRAVVQLGEGEMKIRLGNSWTLNYGDTGLDETLDQDGDNIPVTAGYYQIIANFNPDYALKNLLRFEITAKYGLCIIFRFNHNDAMLKSIKYHISLHFQSSLRSFNA